jgi:hypothetical protein
MGGSPCPSKMPNGVALTKFIIMREIYVGAFMVLIFCLVLFSWGKRRKGK